MYWLDGAVAFTLMLPAVDDAGVFGTSVKRGE